MRGVQPGSFSKLSFGASIPPRTCSGPQRVEGVGLWGGHRRQEGATAGTRLR